MQHNRLLQYLRNNLESLEYHNNGNGTTVRVAQTDHDFPLTDQRIRPAVQNQLRLAGLKVDNLNILKSNLSQSHADSFHEGLFCGKTCGKTLNTIGLWGTIEEFPFGVDAAEEL